MSLQRALKQFETIAIIRGLALMVALLLGSAAPGKLKNVKGRQSMLRSIIHGGYALFPPA